MKKIKEALINHYNKYPMVEIEDLFKFIYQSSFGCEHMITSPDNAINYISEESKEITEGAILIDKLDGSYSRVHLNIIKEGMSEKTLGKLFYLSSKKEESGTRELTKRLDALKALIENNTLDFSISEFNKKLTEWKEKGYPAIHHSQVFKNAYNPKYRVISNDFIPFLPLFIKIDKMLKEGSKIVAIEGGSASGKTTLSTLLKSIYDCTVFHTDDFFLQPYQRTKDRLLEVGGNLDRERFLQEVIRPLIKSETINYKRFDCSTQKILPGVIIEPKDLVIIEGAYSMHPEFTKYYDYSVFLDIDFDLQKERINIRNTPEFAKRFFNEWIPMEEKYFEETLIKRRVDLIISIKKD